MMARLTFILSAAAIVAGCTPTTQSGPNGAFIDAGSASQLFNAVCGSTAPTFDNFYTVATAGDFIRDDASDAYKHVKFDLSVALAESRTTELCRMEFRSSEDPINLALFISGTLTAIGPMNLDQETGFATRELAPNLIFTFQPKIDGDTLHSAWIEAGVR